MLQFASEDIPEETGAKPDRLGMPAWIIGAVAALVPVAFFGYGLSPLLTPSSDEIQQEQQRRQKALVLARGKSWQDGGGVIQPGISGLRGVESAASSNGIAEEGHPQVATALDPPLMDTSTTPSLGTPVAVTQPGLPFPANGSVEWYFRVSPADSLGLMAIRDYSGDGLNKTIRVRPYGRSTVYAQVYLRPGGQAELYLPLGAYDVSFATGTAWHGPDQQYGADGNYYEAKPFDVRHDARRGGLQGINIPPAGSHSDNAVVRSATTHF